MNGLIKIGTTEPVKPDVWLAMHGSGNAGLISPGYSPKPVAQAVFVMQAQLDAANAAIAELYNELVQAKHELRVSECTRPSKPDRLPRWVHRLGGATFGHEDAIPKAQSYADRYGLVKPE